MLFFNGEIYKMENLINYNFNIILKILEQSRLYLLNQNKDSRLFFFTKIDF